MTKWILCCSLFALVILCSAEVIKIDDSQTTVKVINANENGMQIEFKFGEFMVNPVDIDGLTYHQLKIAGEPVTFQKGEPELPFFARSIIIPSHSNVKLAITEFEAVDYNFQPVPSKGTLSRTVNPEDIAWTFSDTYSLGNVYPVSNTESGEPYILREMRGMVIKANPFVYDAGQKILTVRHRMIVEVIYAGNSEINTLSQDPIHYSREFEYIYSNQFLNFASNRYTPLAETGKILVISYANYMDEMQPYVTWKEQMGIPIQMVNVATIGTTATEIKAYIQAQYNLGGLAYVQLVGDVAQMPALACYANYAYGGSDPSFSLLAGSDNYPDIFIGRFSAETEAQVTTQVNKTIYYERDMGSPAWLKQAIGIASSQGVGDDGEFDNQHIDNLRTQLLSYGYTTVDQIYDTNGGTAAMVTTKVNLGRDLINYCGHGSISSWSSTGFSSTNVNALTNDNKLPIIFSVACVNGNFSGSYSTSTGIFAGESCFAEAWLRAKNTSTGNPTGAVAFYGSSVNQYWNPPMQAQDESINLYTADSKTTIGGLWFSSSCSMMDAYGSTGVEMFKTWNIFGDASLRLYTAPPTVTTNFRINRNGANMTLSWNAAAGAVSYKIYRSSDPYATNWGSPFATTTQTNWTDSTISGFAKYFYRVTASTTP